MRKLAATLIGTLALGVIATTAAAPANAAASFGFSLGGPGVGFNYYDGPRYRSCYDYYSARYCDSRYARRYYDPYYYGPRYYRDRGYWYGRRY